VQAKEHAYSERLVINVKQNNQRESAEDALEFSIHDKDMAAYGLKPVPGKEAKTEQRKPDSTPARSKNTERPSDRPGPSGVRATDHTPQIGWGGPSRAQEETSEKLLHSFIRVATDRIIHCADQHHNPTTGLEWIRLLSHIRIVLIHQGPNLTRKVANAYYTPHDPAKIPADRAHPSGVLAVLPGGSFYQVLQINLGKGPIDFYREIVEHHEVDRILRAVQFARHAYANQAGRNYRTCPLQVLAIIGAQGMTQHMDRVPPHLLCSKIDRQMKYWKDQSVAGSAYWLGTGIRTVDNNSNTARYVVRLNQHMSVLNL
jgi:hypothetical protein